MTTERDPRTRIVLSWLQEEAHENAERVLLRALDVVDTTPQRRYPWPTWRSDRLAVYGKLIAASAAVLLVAVIGLLPGGPGTGGSRAAPPFGPAGNGVIALAKDGDIFVADRPGGDTRPLVAGPEVDTGPMFSPDGTRLAFRRGSFLMVADANGTSVIQVTPEPIEHLSFAPDGRAIVGVTVIDGDKRVIVRPLDPAASPTVLDIRMPVGWMYIVAPSFRPSNPQEVLLVTQLDPDGPEGPLGIYLYDLATGGIRTIVEPAGAEWIAGATWSRTGEHIIYDREGVTHVVAADGSGGQALDAWRDRLSPVSNNGTRIVADRDIFKVGETDTHPGDDSYLSEAVVPIDGEGEPVELACGLGMKIECASSWIWSPDDSMLIGSVRGEGAGPYLLADPATGQVTELGWAGYDTPTWQRVAP